MVGLLFAAQWRSISFCSRTYRGVVRTCVCVKLSAQPEAFSYIGYAPSKTDVVARHYQVTRERSRAEGRIYYFRISWPRL